MKKLAVFFLLMACHQQVWAQTSMDKTMKLVTPDGMEGAKAVTEYYQHKKEIKAAHPDWSSDQISRYSACKIGVTIIVRSLAEKDEQDDLIKQDPDLCIFYAQAKPQ